MTELSSTLLSDYSKLSEDDIVRCEMPADIAEKCLKFCQTFVGGSWNNAKSSSEITIKRISGGLANLMVHVHLNESVAKETNFVYCKEPSDVAIKFYSEKHLNFNSTDSERFNELNILTITSQNGISPTIYGIASDGFVQSFYQVRNSAHFIYFTLNTLIFSMSSLELNINKMVNCCKSWPNKLLVFTTYKCRLTKQPTCTLNKFPK